MIMFRTWETKLDVENEMEVSFEGLRNLLSQTSNIWRVNFNLKFDKLKLYI